MRYKKYAENLIVFQNRFYDEKSGATISPVLTQNYEIVQAADSYYLADFEIGRHKQYCDFEITFVSYNKLNVSTNSQSDLAQKNDAYLSFSGDTHSLSSNASTRFIAYAFNVKKNSPIYPLFEKVKNKFKDISSRKLTIPSINGVLTSLMREFYSINSAEMEFAIDQMTTDLLVKLARFGQKDDETDLFDNKELFARVLNFIDENYLLLQSLDEIGARFGYSYNYIYKLFLRYNGKSPSDYITSLKMDFAKEYLLSHSVTQTSEKLGYTSPYNFSRAYKKHFGKSPKSK